MSAPTTEASVANLTAEYIAYTNSPTLMAQSGTIFGFSAAVVTLRIYVRLAMVKAFGKDDFFMLIAMVSKS